MSWVVLSVIAALSYILLFVLPKRLALHWKLKAIDGPQGFPIIGSALEFRNRKDVLKVIDKYLKMYGGRAKFFLGLQPYIGIATAADTEKVLSSQVHIDKSPDYDVLHPWLGTGLLTGRGEKWFHRRKQLTPAFHFKILEDFLRVFNEQCLVFKDVLESKGNRRFDCFPVITHCALDIICETAMGRSIFAQKKSDSTYVKAIYRLSELVQYRQVRPWLTPDFTWNLTAAGREQKEALKIVHDFTDKVIRERKQERLMAKKEENEEKPKETEDDNVYMNASKKRLAFLDLLLDAQETDTTLTDNNIREETDTFMFEGHDTTSAGASWITFLLALNPSCQEKVHQELDEIFGEDRTRDVTMTDLTKMKYLESCIKEGLRLFPSVPFVARQLAKDLELDDAVVLPKECIVVVVLYFLHRDPNFFPEPLKYDPDRFLPEKSQGRHPYAYAPFSAGPRNCIGQKFALMEEKVLLSTVFRNFRVKAEERLEDVVVLCELITRPDAGLHISLQKR